MDQSGASFAKVTGRSLRKGVRPKNMALIHTGVRTKGKLDHVTIMSVFSAAGTALKPVIVFPGVQAHHCVVKGQVQTLHSFLPPCYLYQRNPAGVDSQIILEWAVKFTDETKELRSGGQKLLLVIGGHGSHIQFKPLHIFRENGIVEIALPSHTSHVLPALIFFCFSSSYKSF